MAQIGRLDGDIAGRAISPRISPPAAFESTELLQALINNRADFWACKWFSLRFWVSILTWVGRQIDR